MKPNIVSWILCRHAWPSKHSVISTSSQGNILLVTHASGNQHPPVLWQIFFPLVLFCRYITVGHHEQQKRHMYYYFATSERDPALDPVVVWINGGPGCSGFSAFIHSIGKNILLNELLSSCMHCGIVPDLSKKYSLHF